MNSKKCVRLFGLTDVGCVRNGNEDCFLIQPMGSEVSCLNQTGPYLVEGEQDILVAVSDGMGGAAAGEVASQTALTTLGAYLSERRGVLQAALPKETSALLEDGILAANQAVFQKAQECKAHKGMGATLTVLFIQKDIAYLCQVGDSRAYVLRNRRLYQITRDQSFVGHLVEMGSLTPEQAHTHPQRNVILQALGTQEVLNVDLSYLPLCHGDVLFLCSDGLYGEFYPKDLTKNVMSQIDVGLEKSVPFLVDQAKRAGGKDNITLVALRLIRGFPLREPGEHPKYLPFPMLCQEDPFRKQQSLFL